MGGDRSPVAHSLFPGVKPTGPDKAGDEAPPDAGTSADGVSARDSFQGQSREEVDGCGSPVGVTGQMDRPGVRLQERGGETLGTGPLSGSAGLWEGSRRRVPLVRR